MRSGSYCWCGDLRHFVWRCRGCEACWRGRARPLSSTWPAAQGGLALGTPGSRWSRCPLPRQTAPGWTWARLSGSRSETAKGVRTWNKPVQLVRISQTVKLSSMWTRAGFQEVLQEDHKSQPVWDLRATNVDLYFTLTPHIQRDFPRGSSGRVNGYTGVNSSVNVQGLLDCQRAL